MSDFPTSLPSFTNLDGNLTLAANSHAGRHNKVHDEIAAVAAKVGIDSSADTGSIDYRLATVEDDVTALQAGSTNSVYEGETPTGTINGSNQSFTVAHTYVATSLKVYKNGIRLMGGGQDYTETSGGFTMVTAPATGTRLLVDYMVSAGLSNNADTLDGYHASQLWQIIYPVGSIYMSTASTSPQILFGGTWVAYAEGRVIVGKAAAGTFQTAGSTGGAETHTLTSAEMPSHTHSMGTVTLRANVGNYANGQLNLDDFAGSAGPISASDVQVGNGWNGTLGSAGSGGAHNNLQPYVVAYLWQRTA